jgi:hypothetical protein
MSHRVRAALIVAALAAGTFLTACTAPGPAASFYASASGTQVIYSATGPSGPVHEQLDATNGDNSTDAHRQFHDIQWLNVQVKSFQPEGATCTITRDGQVVAHDNPQPPANAANAVARLTTATCEVRS